MGIRLLRQLQPIFVLLALALIFLLLQSQWEELQSYRWQLDPLWFAVAAGATAAAWSIERLGPKDGAVEKRAVYERASAGIPD